MARAIATRRAPCFAAVILLTTVWCGSNAATAAIGRRDASEAATAADCRENSRPGLVWGGARDELSFAEIAAYAAPVLWFSPDEPLLGGVSGPEIAMPIAFPFEEAGSHPVVYFRVRRVLVTAQGDVDAVRIDHTDRSNSVIRLEQIVGVDVDYFFYYPFEVGLGGHIHDVESVELRLRVYNQRDCPAVSRHSLVVERVVGKAHGLLWYDNTLDSFFGTRFPIHILVEEGKHASCPDANGDGRYTPGYDVTRRINDAWGVRDIIRGGALYASSFQSWMAKVRRPEHRVLPPLPVDSHVHDSLAPDSQRYDYAVYELRPFPSPVRAAPDLMRFLTDKGDADWPKVEVAHVLSDLGEWVDPEAFIKSLSIAYRYDGSGGVCLTYPLFVIRPYNEPLGGGWINQRLYLRSRQLRDTGWQLQYTSSASRWFDRYFAAGLEWDHQRGGSTIAYGVIEQGIKLRANVRHSPLRVLGLATDFWGVRAGFKARGFFPVRDWNCVVEVGAGAF